MQLAMKRSGRIRGKLLAACCGLLASGAADANPQGANVAAGQVGFANPGPKMLQITNSPGAVINWNSFSIATDETTRFVQQNAASTVLNRVTGNVGSQLLGQLASNGRVFLINPAGILIGRDAVIDTAGVVLSTLNMSDDDFRKGVLKFADGGGAGPIANHGYIKTAPGGETVLIAPSITNAPEAGNEQSGVIEGPDGKLLLAAGHTISITSLDHPDITFDVSAPDGEVINLGKLVVNGGMASVLAGTIRHGGTISADAVGVDAAGRVVLMAAGTVDIAAGSDITARGLAGVAGGSVDVTARAPASALPAATATVVAQSGTIDVSGGQGGTVRLEGDSVTVSGTVGASGETGGGSVQVLGTDVAANGAKISANTKTGTAGAVRIGGDFHGAAGTRTATTTTVDALSEFHADASGAGDGGTVVIWSDHTTEFRGLASARGGYDAGDGGRLEVSGKDLLGFHGSIDVGAPQGEAGSLLLDPGRIIIIPGGTTGEIRDPTPFPNDQFGGFSSFSVLPNGNLLFVNQNAGNTGVTAAGEVYLFDSKGAYLGGVAGTAQNERLGSWGVWDLFNGNLLVQDPNASNGGLTQAGAVILLSASTGGEIGRTFGRSSNELFGTSIVSPTTGNALWYHFYAPTENLLVQSTGADVGGVVDAGAVVMLSATTGLALGEVTGNTAGEQLGSVINFGLGAASNYLIRSAGNTANGAAGAGTVILASSVTGQEIGRVSGNTAGENFGSLINFNVGGSGNYVVRSAGHTVAGQVGAGTVVLIDSASGLELGRVSGTTMNENFGSLTDFNVVPGGNYVVRSPNEDVAGQAAVGTVVLVNAATGTQIGRVSGTTANEGFGSIVQYGVVPGGNYVVQSQFEDVAGQAAAGTVVMVSGTSGLALGRVDGTTANEQLGAQVDYFVGGGSNYVIRSPDEQVAGFAAAGAVILASSANGTEIGRVSGGSAGARFGDNVDYFGVPFGTYLVRSPTATPGAGLIGAGTAVLVKDTTGLEIGRTDGLAAGDALGTYAPVMRASGNYVLRVPEATVGGLAAAGSIVLVDGTTGTRLQSFDGDAASERLGRYDMAFDGFVGGSSVVDFNVLGGADFLVYSPAHGGNAGLIAQLMDTPVAGSIFRGGLAGASNTDLVGLDPVTVLPNGNYVIADPFYSNTTNGFIGPVSGAGGVFVMDAGTAAPIASVLGNAFNEGLGSNIDYNLFFTFCCSNEFAVLSSTHSTTLTGGAGDFAGAVYFIDGGTGAVGSFVGTAGSQVGLVGLQQAAGGVIVPAIFASPGGVSGAGSVYLLDSTTAAVIGQVDGTTVGENIGSSIDTSSLGSSNFLIMSPIRTVAGNANAGAVLLVDGLTGTQLGGVFGTSAGELLGQSSWIQPLFSGANAGNYIVTSPLADTAGGVDAGSAILVAGIDGNAIGRLDGTTANERLGTLGFTQFYERGTGNYFVTSTRASPGGIANAGSVYLADGTTGAMLGKVDGTAVNEFFGSSVDLSTVGANGDILVTSTGHTTAGGLNAGTVVQMAATDLGGGNLVRGRVDGISASEQLGAFGYSTLFASGHLLFRSPQASPGGLTNAGSLYFYDPASGTLLGRLDGTGANERLGSNFWVERANGNLFIPSPNASPNGISGAGSLLLANSGGGLIGRLDGNHVAEALGGTVDYFSVPTAAFVRSYLHDNGGLPAAGGLFTVADVDLGGGNIVRGKLLGNAANEQLGLYGASFSNGQLMVRSPDAANGGISKAGALILADAATLGEIGRLSGTSTDEHLALYSPVFVSGGNFFMQSPFATVGGLGKAGSVLLVNGTTFAVIGHSDGSTANEQYGADLRSFAGDYFVASPNEDVGTLIGAGAVVQIDPTTGAALQRVTGTSANEHFGSDPGFNGWRLLGDGRILIPSINASVGGVAGAGRVAILDPNGGVGSGPNLSTNALFATNPGSDFVITNEAIEAILGTGADLVLQANNDIVSLLGADIQSLSGTLTLQAGRSILLNAPIDVPLLTLVAHETEANGVLTQYTGTGSGDVVLDTTLVNAAKFSVSGQTVAVRTSQVAAGGLAVSSDAFAVIDSRVKAETLSVLSRTFDVAASQIVANSLTFTGQTLTVAASQDALAEPLVFGSPSPQFFADYLAAVSPQVGGSAFLLGGELLDINADSVVLHAGPAAGAFAALASVGDFRIETRTLELTAGTGANADAVLLGLGGIADLTYQSCTGCTELEFDPFLQSKSQTGAFLNIVRSPTIDAILTMLGMEKKGDSDDEKKKDKEKEKQREEGKDCAK